MSSAPPPLPPPITFRESRSRRISALVSGVILLIYAGFFRWAFAEAWMKDSGSVPFACGALSVAIARWSGDDYWLVPADIGCSALLLGLVICIVMKIEASRPHLTSHHRLSTRFNAYAGWWSEKIMDQIQGSILEVIRHRAEHP